MTGNFQETFEFGVLEFLYVSRLKVRQSQVVSEFRKSTSYDADTKRVSEAADLLGKKGYVDIIHEGSKKFLKITPEGENAYMAERMTTQGVVISKISSLNSGAQSIQ